MILPQTFTYKIINACEIKADVYKENDSKNQPVIIFIHGGGLIGGGRKASPIIIDLLVKAGYVVVSIDYRLAPESKLSDIVEDVQDAFAWVRNEGEALFNIDPTRIGVIGNSAGGYLTLACGYLINPPPKALVSLYGYGDITGSWYTKPDPFYCAQPRVNEEQARKSVGTRAISEITQPGSRMPFYLYCRQNGIWPKEVTGYDPEIEPEKFKLYCPIENISKEFPPTLLLHGDVDTDVPCEESIQMANMLKKIGVEHELKILPGKGHCFEESGEEDPIIAEALNNIIVFLKQHV